MVTRFVEHLNSMNYSPHTVKAYEKDVNTFFNALMELRKERDPIKKWAQQLTGAPASVNRRIAAVQSYYAFCVKHGHMDVNPAKDLTFRKLPKRLPRFHPEMNKIMEQEMNDVEHAVMSLLYETGIRLSELVSLETKNLSPGSIKVYGKGKKERIIPITPKLYLQLFKVSQKTFVFDLTARQVQYMVSRLTGMSPHKVRHTFATDMLKNGASIIAVRDLLGHSSVNTTEKYTHIDIDYLKRVHAQCHPHGGSKT